MEMKMEGGDPSSKRMRSVSLGVGENGLAADHISTLPDTLLGEIISLLPTKEGGRTQILASRWRHLWRSAPLNLDCSDLDNQGKLAGVLSSILSSHQGLGRRFCVETCNLSALNASVGAWLRSAALYGLQELELSYGRKCLLPPVSESISRFSTTLRVATIGKFNLPDDIVQPLRFPLLKQLGLEFASISESSLHSLINGCPILEALLIHHSSGFRCVRINSHSIRSIGVRAKCHNMNELQFEELVIENAPCLERLLNLNWNFDLRLTVLSAPNLKTFGYLYESSSSTRVLASIVIQGLHVDNLATVVSTVKSLAIYMSTLSLDMVIELMRCFPFLEKLCIRGYSHGGKKLWRRKHQNLNRCIDIRLKSIAVEYYEGYKSDVDFLTFFVMNARVLESRILWQNSARSFNSRAGLQKVLGSILLLMLSAVFGISNMSESWI